MDKLELVGIWFLGQKGSPEDSALEKIGLIYRGRPRGVTFSSSSVDLLTPK